MKPEQVHPTHDVREEGILASDPVCQRCRASVYGSPTTLLVECSGLPPTVEQYLTVQPASGRITELERQLKVAREALRNIRALATKRQNVCGPDGCLTDIECFASAALEGDKV